MTRSRSPIGPFALTLLALALVAWTAYPSAPATVHAAPTRPMAQAAPPLPPTLDLDALAARTAALHHANGGATVNLYQGDLAGQDLYVVVVYPDLTEAVPGPDLDPARVRQFIADHLALLVDRRNNVGTWYDDAADTSYLDVSTALPDRAQALALSQQYNQMGVFDLARMTTIAVGGSGVPPANLPPIDQRLPPFPGEGTPGR